MIEELLDALKHTKDCDSCPSDDEQKNDVVMAIGDSKSQVTSKRTMKLQRIIGTQEPLILVDSGSVGSFITENLANQLKYTPQECEAAYFVAADGSPMTCTREFLIYSGPLKNTYSHQMLVFYLLSAMT